MYIEIDYWTKDLIHLNLILYGAFHTNTSFSESNSSFDALALHHAL